MAIFNASTDDELDKFGYIVDWATADVILQSSDGVQFPMSRHALSAASLFFLPQSPDTHTHRGEFIYHDLPAVPMSERADVFGPVLRCCHARVLAGISSTGLLASMLEVADKYDMLGAVLGAIERSAQGGSVLRLVERDPATIYALAYHHHLPDLARASVRSLLRLDVDTIDASKDEPLVQGYLTPHARKCLKEYHWACSRAVRNVLRYPVWAPCERETRLWLDDPDRYVWWTCASCPATEDPSWRPRSTSRIYVSRARGKAAGYRRQRGVSERGAGSEQVRDVRGACARAFD
ncbi:hypothetical protein PUNSTDRAFT_139187 [Punctularia strigosozonata HHB-11173 SS5]|uniref:BTB domain-containing protein n=1 Tax=Punctularia strigosozonata (strain HHB-11173) TaxID=741275 RepID=R7S274_PUNST|nr:uncharacterized protein PUNSTDRAFT_139187 [Punctularia strigosozonata HHB-11173 SS5]EIN03882.1 hypothetical protein PUNSTDRAFT_139187 [Punctularia strigosozonata HHB-11173 SS5]